VPHLCAFFLAQRWEANAFLLGLINNSFSIDEKPARRSDLPRRFQLALLP
jgi:hypothetical protein